MYPRGKGAYHTRKADSQKQIIIHILGGMEERRKPHQMGTKKHKVEKAQVRHHKWQVPKKSKKPTRGFRV